jgi:hypothetical protein
MSTVRTYNKLKADGQLKEREKFTLASMAIGRTHGR